MEPPDPASRGINNSFHSGNRRPPRRWPAGSTSASLLTRLVHSDHWPVG